MSIRLNHLTRGKMNCIFLLEVNAYFHLSISSCNFNCSYLHRNIPVYKSAHSLQPYGLDSREMKLEAPCTPKPSYHQACAIPLWGVFFCHLEEARAFIVFPVSPETSPAERPPAQPQRRKTQQGRVKRGKHQAA